MSKISIVVPQFEVDLNIHYPNFPKSLRDQIAAAILNSFSGNSGGNGGGGLSIPLLPQQPAKVGIHFSLRGKDVSTLLSFTGKRSSQPNTRVGRVVEAIDQKCGKGAFMLQDLYDLFSSDFNIDLKYRSSTLHNLLRAKYIRIH